MGITEVILAALCVNMTCPGDTNEETVLLRQQQKKFMVLAEQLKNENLIITTLPNGVLSGYIVENGTTIGTGVAFDIIKILQKKYGFSYKVVKPEDLVFNGEKGVSNMLIAGRADLAAAFLPLAFNQKVRFSRSLDTGEWVVLMRRPTESATGSGLLAPFTATVWVLTIVSVLVVGPIIYLLIYLRARLCKSDAGDDKVFPLPACMWFVYGALLKQGSTLNPETDSSRLLFSTWWIFITILTAFYTANLTAFLTLSKFTLPITAPSDIKAKHYQWVTNKGNGIADHVDESKGNLFQYIGAPKRELEATDDVILHKYVTKENLMYIRERNILEYIMYDDYKKKTQNGIAEKDRCTYVITEFSVANFARGFAFSPNFIYHELFDSTIQYLVESGIITFKQREDLPDTKICPLNLGNKERRLQNSDLIMTYMIVGGGLIISAVIFLIELLIEYCKAITRKPKPIQSNTVLINHHNNNYKFEAPKPFVTPPPSYHTLYNAPFVYNNGVHVDCKKKMVNGTEYWLVNNKGNTELIPYRTPSALLYQFRH